MPLRNSEHGTTQPSGTSTLSLGTRRPTLILRLRGAGASDEPSCTGQEAASRYTLHRDDPNPLPNPLPDRWRGTYVIYSAVSEGADFVGNEDEDESGLPTGSYYFKCPDMLIAGHPAEGQENHATSKFHQLFTQLTADPSTRGAVRSAASRRMANESHPYVGELTGQWTTEPSRASAAGGSACATSTISQAMVDFTRAYEQAIQSCAEELRAGVLAKLDLEDQATLSFRHVHTKKEFEELSGRNGDVTSKLRPELDMRAYQDELEKKWGETRLSEFGI
ncbi:uncharacterized protein I303_101530 [Kwoniella dejecticola CBS 10117]|uniref:Uncharacterized protein n=1 Tax=Kwoniella dejecticola CBS 10117 TaxID=1296121 RepID=A0A1A6ADK2_9TREE|nr:uncharacterized protein I303_02338 [Kwoniella dejecticola CBS 10117]OBR88119.1 hypothetical protein I303_02338 [Kwoniella dejecticola CBS 10117]